ncbi:heavy-metal-associated domain-containing protein [Streptomyces sp. NPDC013457]|uniref:heavy-metal-associated domain-containing protein n=1 Tax=Streptomyces sp. NPDC013457 TaxID=3364866 RepID=UPI003700B9E2
MSCCTSDGSCSTPNSAAPADSQRLITVYNVSGMTCGHCTATLTKEIGALASVQAVEVNLDKGQVSVTTTSAPDDALLEKVIDEAGYELTGRAA